MNGQGNNWGNGNIGGGRGNNNNNINNNNNNNNGNNNNNNGAKGRAFVIGNGEAKNENNVVAGTFYINNKPDSLLFDSCADLSYVSFKFY